MSLALNKPHSLTLHKFCRFSYVYLSRQIIAGCQPITKANIGSILQYLTFIMRYFADIREHGPVDLRVAGVPPAVRLLRYLLF